MNNREPKTIDNANVVFRNFEGREGQYNDPGDRNFCIILSGEMAEEMAALGYNVKTLKPYDVSDAPKPYIQVTVSFKGRKPPRLVMIGSRGRVDLDESTCELLDQVDIKRVDCIIRPYHWGPIRGDSGIAAYLQSFYLFVQEDELEQRYAHIPRVGETAQPLEIPAYDFNGEVINGELVNRLELEHGILEQ